jgi:hypothetical protein
VGEASVVDYTDAQLQQLINRGWINEDRLRRATLQNLLNAGLNEGQAAELRAVLQGAFSCRPITLRCSMHVAEACLFEGHPLHAWFVGAPSAKLVRHVCSTVGPCSSCTECGWV